MVKPKKEKKRTRDKILRDLGCGKLALELRKKGAFLGYEYRRPRGAVVVVKLAWKPPITKLLAACTICFMCGYMVLRVAFRPWQSLFLHT